MPKGNTIRRCYRVVKMFQAGPVTVNKIRCEFKISKQAAQRMINEAIRAMPIFETGFDKTRLGRPGIIYELMED